MKADFVSTCGTRALHAAAVKSVGYVSRNALHLVNLPNLAASMAGGIAFYAIERVVSQGISLARGAELQVPGKQDATPQSHTAHLVFQSIAEAALGAAILGLCGVAASSIATAMLAAMVGAAILSCVWNLLEFGHLVCVRYGLRRSIPA